ncbi:MAG: chorismate synthase [Lachnospiraceae bacterium]|nr:chorismate synthase [Lachnospiraceae bacterium]
MAGSSFGTILKVTTFGESHGIGLGAVLDGCPAGLPVNEEIIQQYLNLRKPGQTKYSTPRKEQDKIRILSGVFEGRTTGTPILLLAENETQRSQDYSEIASYYRPGHADFTFDAKYGFRDYRGGGRSSGRETLGRVAAGAIAIEFLKTLGIEICAYTKSIGSISCQKNDYAASLAEDNRASGTALSDRLSRKGLDRLRSDKLASPLYMPDADASLLAEDALQNSMEHKDSMGGIIECVVSGMPAGIGEPVFDKLDASLAKAMLSIGSVKGFELGSGFAAAESRGSENNDAFVPMNGTIRKATNHAGGILGGMSDGSDIIFRTAIKPTPSIFSEQSTVNKNGDAVSVEIKGRHDPVIVPRAVVVVEAMTALTIADALLVNMHSRLDGVKDYYKRG